MHVLFLEILTQREWATASIGPAFLAGFLRARGHTASMIAVDLDMGAEALAEAVRAAAPGLVGVSMTSRQWLRGREVVGQLSERLDVPVVAGGLHPTFSADEVLDAPGFDYVCLGEGEEALLELVEHLEAGVPVLDHQLHNLQLSAGEPPELRKPFEPIDELPFMARDMLHERHGVMHMVTQRGCPFLCTYCAARMYNQMYSGYGRRRSHQSVAAEIDLLRAQGLTYIIFLDDTFTLNRKWVSEFCAQHKKQGSVPFSLHARAETVTQDLLRDLADAGCRHITYGVESGSERLRRDVMKRIVSNDKLVQVFAWTRALGIITTANYMLGVPYETRDDVEQTLALHERLEPDDFGYFVFYPYPGTPMFHTVKEAGMLPDDWQERPANHRASILDLPDLSPADIAELYDRFTALRQRDYLRKHGDALDAQGRAEVARRFVHTAATG